MASRPSYPLPLSLEFPQNPGHTDGPPDAISTHSKEPYHALQNDHARTPGAAPGVVQHASEGRETTQESAALRAHAEIPASLLGSVSIELMSLDNLLKFI